MRRVSLEARLSRLEAQVEVSERNPVLRVPNDVEDADSWIVANAPPWPVLVVPEKLTVEAWAEKYQEYHRKRHDNEV